MRKRRPPKGRSSKTVQKRLVIEALDHEGVGLSEGARVPFALPGEAVEVSLKDKTGRVTQRLNSSPERVEPLCQHFGAPGDRCGGCTLQHLGAARALDLKKARLLASLARSFPDAEVAQVYSEPARSRRRALFAISPNAAGFRSLGDRRIVSLKDCAVIAPALLNEVEPLRSLARGLNATFDAQLTLTSTGIDVALSGLDGEALDLDQRQKLAQFAEERDYTRLSVSGAHLAERRSPVIHFAGVPVSLPPGTFLQATENGERALTQEVVEACQGAKRIADLFAGLGTFSLPLAKNASVYAADSAGPAIASLAAAAKQADYQLTAEARDLFKRPLMSSELKAFDAVVFDPPRAGARAQAAEIAAAGVPTVVAVSCNPSSLARDLTALAATYDLTRLVLVDQFGWSPHIEAVAVLRRL